MGDLKVLSETWIFLLKYGWLVRLRVWWSLRKWDVGHYWEGRNGDEGVIEDSGGHVRKPTHKKIEKIDQCLRIQPLRGGNLHYITKMNNSWMIQMTKPPFYI